MKSLFHWVQYFYRISGDPTIDEINEVMFIKLLDTDMCMKETRKKLIDQSNKKANEVSLGPSESENKWKEWESKSINYLSVDGVP